jgi:chemotaxis family two-component system response regulator Rcp1
MPINILLVEDNEGDVRLIREVLGEVSKTARLHVVADGAEAMEFPGCQGRYINAPRPQLILLDLNMPKLHGREVLARVRADPHLQTIPVMVLKGSQAQSDVVRGHELRANSRLKKPDNSSVFEEMVESLNDFWLKRVKLPKNTKRGREKPEINQRTFLMMSGEKSGATNQSTGGFSHPLQGLLNFRKTVHDAGYAAQIIEIIWDESIDIIFKLASGSGRTIANRVLDSLKPIRCLDITTNPATSLCLSNIAPYRSMHPDVASSY